MWPCLWQGGFRSVAFRQVSSRIGAACSSNCLSKASVAARSWAGLQPGFTPECQRNKERLCPCVAHVNCRENADIAVK